MKSVDEGIFIHRISYSETSLITTFYTRNAGMKKFLFKGGKKKSHQLYPLSHSEIHFYGRPESDLKSLTAVEPISATDFQFHPIKSTIAFFIGDIIRMAIRSEEEDKGLFEFILSKVQELNSSETLGSFPAIFLVELALHLGISPLVENERPGVPFDLTSGTIGGVPALQSEVQRGDHVDRIVQLLKNPENNAVIPKTERDAIIRTMLDYYKIHLPGFSEPGTYQIIREVLS